MLDGILSNQTDLLITEHATDTHGATLANFALFDLVDLQLSPRIRDLGKITLYRTGPRAEFTARYPSAGHLLTRRLNEELITGMWDDLLRAASVKGGHATAALVVGKLCSSKRQQNALAAAIKEYGALLRTIYAARYLADETYRRRISRQLNKGPAAATAASGCTLVAALTPESRGHCRSPRPCIWRLALRTRQCQCIHPGLAAVNGAGRLRFGRLDVVATGRYRSPVRVPEDLHERDPAPCPDESHSHPMKATASGTFSQNHNISIPPPGPGALRRRQPGSGPPFRLPAGNDQLPPGCPAGKEVSVRQLTRLLSAC